jgi:hypothetical protein
MINCLGSNEDLGIRPQAWHKKIVKIPKTKAGFVMRSGMLGDVEQTAITRAGI